MSETPRSATATPKAVAITGSTGLVGTALKRKLRADGFAVRGISRSAKPDDSSTILWKPREKVIEADKLEGVDAVVHLAGESIAEGRWTDEKKERIRVSRVLGTTFLCEALANLRQKPRVLVSASAVGYYGDRGVEALDESSAPGKGFLADVAQQWEDATKAAKEAGIRVVILRFGVVLSPDGGALAKLLPIFKAGGGGVVGNGKQYMSWVGLHDLVRVIEFAIENDSVSGVLNAVSPNPVPNREFVKTLADVLNRPAIFPAPAFAIKLAFGEMGKETILASTRVLPRELEKAGFSFSYPNLEPALRHELEKA
ncbi:MAG: TIGR01777 family oxidoreductase [Phycisphaerae bacterium]